jgi:hypothetical protein
MNTMQTERRAVETDGIAVWRKIADVLGCDVFNDDNDTGEVQGTPPSGVGHWPHLLCVRRWVALACCG